MVIKCTLIHPWVLLLICPLGRPLKRAPLPRFSITLLWNQICRLWWTLILQDLDDTFKGEEDQFELKDANEDVAEMVKAVNDSLHQVTDNFTPVQSGKVLELSSSQPAFGSKKYLWVESQTFVTWTWTVLKWIHKLPELQKKANTRFYPLEPAK